MSLTEVERSYLICLPTFFLKEKSREMSAIGLIVFISFVNGSKPHNGSTLHNGSKPNNSSKPQDSATGRAGIHFPNVGGNWEDQEMTNILSVGYIFDENELAELYGASKISLI